MIVDEEGDALASPSLDACDFLNISEEGPWGAFPILGFYPFFIFLHHLALEYLKTSFTQNFWYLLMNKKGWLGHPQA